MVCKLLLISCSCWRVCCSLFKELVERDGLMLLLLRFSFCICVFLVNVDMGSLFSLVFERFSFCIFVKLLILVYILFVLNLFFFKLIKIKEFFVLLKVFFILVNVLILFLFRFDNWRVFMDGRLNVLVWMFVIKLLDKLRFFRFVKGWKLLVRILLIEFSCNFRDVKFFIFENIFFGICVILFNRIFKLFMFF